jgi:PAS domain S-box-containing protein
MAGVARRLRAWMDRFGAAKEAERFRILLEAAPMGMLVVDGEGRIALVNSRIEALLGFGHAELLGRPIETLVPAGIARKGRYAMRKDGSAVPVEVGSNPLRSAGKDLVLMSIVDITERMTAERLEGHMAALVESADDAIIGKSLDGVIRNWNPAAERLLGYRAAEIIGKPVQRLIPPYRRGEMAMILDLIMRGKRVEQFETVRRRKDGSLVDVSLTISPICDRAGTVVGASKIMRDISERKAAERKLQEMHSLLSTVLESATESAIIAVDARLNITVFNAGAERLLGYSAEEMIGRATPAAFHDAGEVSRCAEELSIAEGRAIDGIAVLTEASLQRQAREWTFVRKGGERIAVSLTMTPMSGEAGALLGHVGVAHDVSRQKLDESSLRNAIDHAEHASKAKSEFLANMSHEIRTPLNAVIGLGYLLDHTPLSEEQRQFLAKIQFAGRSLLSVVNNVLDLSKIEAGEMSLEEEGFDLPELVREVVQMLAPQAAGKGIGLTVDPASTLPPPVLGDAARLRQILTNLVNNAIKFTEAGGVTLQILCAEQGVGRFRLRCVVTDTGIGIESGALERLFTPFTQADASTTRRFGGTGLGLSIARRLVELMGGEIGVTSTVGVGSSFWLEIPLRVAADAGSPDGAGLGIVESGGKVRIIIADPAGDVRTGPGAMVRALGWNPQIVKSGELLAAAAVAGAPNMFIVDRALLDGMAQRFPHGDMPPVIVVADHPEEEGERRLHLRPDDALLVRPLTSSALFNAINTVLWKRRDGRDRPLQTTDLDEADTRWLSGVRVLAVDDSEINLEVARLILEKQGATVATCADGAAAVAYVRTHFRDLDIVLMDVQMPVLDGNAATRRIRKELGLTALPIVALTAGALLGERQRSLDVGMNDFVSKPFDPLLLIRKIRHLVERERGKPVALLPGERDGGAPRDGGGFVPSIDAAVVRQMFGDDRALFESLLRRLLGEYSDLAFPVGVADDAPARRKMLERVHKLKGAAGMIGAANVARIAGAAQTALQEDRPVNVVEVLLGRLAQALTMLREEAEPLFRAGDAAGTRGASITSGTGGTSATSGKSATSAAMGAATAAAVNAAEIDDLCALLDEQNLAAMDTFTALTPALKDLLGEDRFGPVHAAIDDLDFPNGAKLLREALSL